MKTSTTSMRSVDVPQQPRNSAPQQQQQQQQQQQRYITSAVVVWTTTTCASVILMSWKLIQWRARKRARTIVRQVVDAIPEDGALIEYHDSVLRERIVSIAIKRASKWMTLSKQQDMVYPMIGQVGGTGCNKKPILTLLPDYVLKPLLYDHRGIREIAFYEAIRIITQSPAHHVHHTYSTFLTGREQPSKSHTIVGSTHTASSSSSSSSFWSILRSSIAITRDYTDTIAMAIAIFVQDPLVLQSERALRDTWRSIQREIDMIRQLQKFTPPYYGVITMNHMHHCSSNSNDNNNHNIYNDKETANDKDSSRHDTVSVNKISSSSCSSNGTTGTHHHTVDPTMLYGTSFDDAHLLLQDLTINYSKPCVMDLKMGVQTYEPDATPEKRAREYGKYPQQTQFGFRIVGMRFYDPSHVDADEKGYRYFDKSYGRSLTEREHILDAFRLYFSAGCTEHSQRQLHTDTTTCDDVVNHNGTLEKVESTNSKEETTKETSNAYLNSNGYSSPSKQCEQPTSSSSSKTPLGMIRRRTVSNLLVQLRPLRRWFEENQSLRFYASSLLLIYEGDVQNSPNPDTVTVKMIDFGRVRREAGGDQGYITGLSTVMNIFVDLLKDDEQKRVAPCC